MDGANASGMLGLAGYAITGSGGRGAGGRYVFADVAELDEIITDLGKLRDGIRDDGDKLRRARQLIVPPGTDVMSVLEARATVDCLDKAYEHNRRMYNYADTELAKMRVARAAYTNTDDEGAVRLRAAGES